MKECPKHYRLACAVTHEGRPLEVEDLCEELFDDDPRLYQALEYLMRCRKKGAYLADLRKAVYYMEKAIARGEYVGNPTAESLADLGATE